MHPTAQPGWLELLRDQDGAFTRAQAAAFGITDSMIRAQVKARRWQRIHPRTYVAGAGAASRISFRTRAWAAVLFAGSGAAASHRTAAYLLGLVDQSPGLIEVSTPAARRPRKLPGIALHRRRNDVRVLGSPPRTSVEDTALDLIDLAKRPDDVVAVITAACQRRLTTASRLRDAARTRARLAWRDLVNDVLADADSAHSALEWRYLRDVERAHRLPASKGQAGARRGRSKLWRDAVYKKYRLVVELDGAAAHPDESRHRDMARDNAVVVEGGACLRYGWHDVAGHACEAALQVAIVLRTAGWEGEPVPCGPDCPVRGFRTSQPTTLQRSARRAS
jgi:very-short-patch-repair endonuclease